MRTTLVNRIYHDILRKHNGKMKYNIIKIQVTKWKKKRNGIFIW